MKTMHKKTPQKIKKILDFLKLNNKTGMHLRGIARATEINPGTVSWIVDNYLIPDFVDLEIIDSYGLKLKRVRLKRDATVDDVLKIKKLRKNIRGIKC